MERKINRRTEAETLVDFLSLSRDVGEYRPVLLPTELDGICDELRTYDQWRFWEPFWVEEIGYPPAGRWSLNPVDPDAGVAVAPLGRAACGPFADAVAVWRRRDVGGVGFVLTCQDPFLIVEIAEALTEAGEMTPEAARWINLLDSYTEVTPSGRGLHIFLRGHLPPGGRCLGNVEMAETDRFVPVTGRHWPATPPKIKERQSAIEALHRELFPTPLANTRPPATVGGSPPAGDAELLAFAFRGANGVRIEALFRGDISVVPGDRNAADLALCSMLSFYTGDDPPRLDRLFRGSSLFRRKWDERHYTDGSTYGQATVAKALEGCILFYSYPKADIEKVAAMTTAVNGPHGAAALKREVLAAASPLGNPAKDQSATRTISDDDHMAGIDPLVLAERKGRAEGLAMREVVLNAHEAAELLKVSPRMLRRTIKPWRRFGSSSNGDRWLLSQLLDGEPVL